MHHETAPHVITVDLLETPYGFTTANGPTSDPARDFTPHGLVAVSYERN